MAAPLLVVEDLKTHFGPENVPIRAVDGVSFVVEEGQTVALVGESGSGKSVTALSLARLLPEPPARYVGGEVVYAGLRMSSASPDAVRGVRGGGIAYVFQDPGTALNPVLRVGVQIREALSLHAPEPDADQEVLRLLRRCGLDEAERVARSFPYQLSGGMQQRVVIAMALACRPRLLVADEPTTALDVSIQAQILTLLQDLQREAGMAVLLITHNLGIVAGMADTVHVMYAGQIVESGATEDVLRRPRHPYTCGLLDAVPRLGAETDRIAGIPGSVPSPAAFPPGCRFAARCPDAQAPCTETMPEIGIGGAAGVRCHFPRPINGADHE